MPPETNNSSTRGDTMNTPTNKIFAVISDVHGNYKALETLLNYCKLRHIDGIIGLGDYVTDSPYPERTITLLKQIQAQYPCYMVRGNRENYMINNARNDQGWKPSSQSGCLHYTAMHLSEKDIAFLEGMPEEMTVDIDGLPRLYICHGVPGNVRGNVDLNPDLKALTLQALSNDYLLGGHSHKQEMYVWNQKSYLNPGSLGLALDGIGGHIHFALIHGNPNEYRWETELISIPYDAASFLKDFSESGLDEIGFVLNRAVKKTITTGINYVFKCVLMAEQATGLPLHLVSEDVWEEIALKLKL